MGIPKRSKLVNYRTQQRRYACRCEWARVFVRVCVRTCVLSFRCASAIEALILANSEARTA